MHNGKVLDSAMEVDTCHHGVLPLKVFLQKRLTCSMGDSNKFSDVLSMYRSWLKCNFTAMHEVTSELIHPSKLEFSSLCVSLLPFRSVCPQGQTPLNSGPRRCSHGQAQQAQIPKFTWCLGRLEIFFQCGQNTTIVCPDRQAKPSACHRKTESTFWLFLNMSCKKIASGLEL